MLRKHPSLVIDPADPFREDSLERKRCAEDLATLVSTLTQPFVLSVNGPYGTGKTTFVKMWIELLKAKGHPCAYFNAWENDFVSDPITALVSEIDVVLDENVRLLSAESRGPDRLVTLRKLSGKALKVGLPLAVRLGTAGLFSLDDATSIGKALTGASDEIAEAAEEYAKERIKQYQDAKETLASFRKELRELLDQIDKAETLKKPLVFVVDELDRCRPDFAVGLLERLKHLFEVEGIVFVLAVHREQLAHSVRQLYGQGVDAEGYLRRLIDLDFRLPEPNLEAYASTLYKSFGFDDLLKAANGEEDDRRTFLPMLIGSAQALGLSLRELEQLCTRLNVYLRAVPKNEYVSSMLAIPLLALQLKHPRDVYADFVQGKTSAADLLGLFGIPLDLSARDLSSGDVARRMLWLTFYRYSQRGGELAAMLDNLAALAGEGEQYLVSNLRNHFKDDREWVPGRLKQVRARLEFTARFALYQPFDRG